MSEQVQPEWSIIVPAYNEARRIGATLKAILATIEQHGWDAELLLVNDGSTDQTQQVLESWASRYPAIRLLNNDRNRGKGYSVRHGMLEAQGRIVMFTDADLSAPMEEASRLQDAIAAGADIAIGSRWLERSRQTIRQPWYRQIFGRCFNLVVRLAMRLPYADTQCGFKAFRREVARDIFRRQKIERWGFDPEILFLARKRGYMVVEVAVSWAHDERSKISYLRDGIRMLLDLAKIRWFAWTGRYRMRKSAKNY